MDEKKNFFDLLDARGALLVGAVGGLLALGTVGFIVLGVFSVKNPALLATSGQVAAQTVPQGGQEQAQAQTPPPPVVPKSDRPKIELFVMSYCPYGLQMEKAYAPAWDLLKNKADIDVKFVSYAMHGLKEVEENTRQYCIQKNQSIKYIAYLKCFTASGDAASCLSSVGISADSLKGCVDDTNKQFGIMAKYNDQSTWLSGQYPLYPIHDALNQKYGVQGSPTLVINGVQANVGRTPEAVKQAICAAFNKPPSECGQALSTVAFVPGFGATQQAGGSAPAGGAGCGT